MATTQPAGGTVYGGPPPDSGGTVYDGGSGVPGQPVSISRHYGGFWIRVLATLIDFVAVSIVVWPVRAFIWAITGLGNRLENPGALGFALGGLFIAAAFNLFANWIYSAGLESSSYQATLGKMALGMKVTDVNGQRISFGRATGRHFAKFLSGMILCIGYIMVAFTQYKQGLHDMIAGTLVERT